MFKVVFKDNIMLLLISLVLLFLTAYMWLFFPLYIVSEWLLSTNMPIVAHSVVVNLCLSVICSLYFVWVPMKICQAKHSSNRRARLCCFMKIQLSLIVIFFIVLSLLPFMFVIM